MLTERNNRRYSILTRATSLALICLWLNAWSKSADLNKRHKIIAAATDYGLETFHDFVVPLRKVYDGEITLLVDVKTFKSNAKTAFARTYKLRLKQLNANTQFGARGDRFSAYAEECASYDFCVACDFRDVIFQRNPFPELTLLFHAANFELLLSEEHTRIKLGAQNVPVCSRAVHGDCTCPYNSNWIRTCWGDDFLESIADFPPICSGVIIGTPKGFQILAAAMLNEMRRTSSIGNCTARDQGHLNYLYYANSIPTKVYVQKQGFGLVNTLGYVPPNEAIMSADGIIRNRDGLISSIVHQYDRFDRIKHILQQS